MCGVKLRVFKKQYLFILSWVFGDLLKFLFEV